MAVERRFLPWQGAGMIRRMKCYTPAIRLMSWLLCALLASCVSSPPPHFAEEPSEEVFSSFEEGCADASTVVLLCEEHECGFFRCRDLDFESGGVQLTRGGGGVMASPGSDALARLQAEGLRGLKGCRTQLRFRKKNPPELLELEIHPHGRLHPDCTPRDRPPPCPTCGRDAFSLPEELLLEAASLPADIDLFRLANFLTVLICTERFVQAVRRLELDEIVFRDVPLR
jgi:hypothetical protein